MIIQIWPLALSCLSIALAQRPPVSQRGRPGSDEEFGRRFLNNESPIWSERVVWDNPPRKDDKKAHWPILRWAIGSTQTLRWKTPCPTTYAVDIFAEGTKLGPGEQKINLLRKKPRYGNDMQIYEWTVSADKLPPSASGMYYFMAWVTDERGVGHLGYSAYVNIIQRDNDDHVSSPSVVQKAEAKRSTSPAVSTRVPEETWTPPALPASEPNEASITAPATTSVIVLATASTTPPPVPITTSKHRSVTITTLAATATSNPFFSHLPLGPMGTWTNTLTLSFVPTTAVVMVTGTPLSPNQGGLRSKQRVWIAVAVVGTVVGLGAVILAVYLLWRRFTGMRVARLEPGHLVVGPNEFVIMRGTEWTDKMRGP